jgi:hypothetical protein
MFRTAETAFAGYDDPHRDYLTEVILRRNLVDSPLRIHRYVPLAASALIQSCRIPEVFNATKRYAGPRAIEVIRRLHTFGLSLGCKLIVDLGTKIWLATLCNESAHQLELPAGGPIKRVLFKFYSSCIPEYHTFESEVSAPGFGEYIRQVMAKAIDITYA